MLPITSTQLLFAFTPSNGNHSPLHILKDGNEDRVDVTDGWALPTLWDSPEFLPNMIRVTDQHRVVNASIKVTYTGTSIANSGSVFVYQGPHIPQFHKVAGVPTKLSVAQMVHRIKTNPRTKSYDVDDFRHGKIFHIERGTQRRVFRTPYTAQFPDSVYGNKLFSMTAASTGTENPTSTTVTTSSAAPTDPSVTWDSGYAIANNQLANHQHTVQIAGGTAMAIGEPIAGVPPTMQALYIFAEGLSMTGSNFLVEGVMHAEIQIDPDATEHVGQATPPNNHTPEPDANARTVHGAAR